MFNNLNLDTIKFPSINKSIETDTKISNEIHITFATVLSKEYFVSFFLIVCNENEYEEYLINDIINICIEQNTYRSINCIIWLLYAGYIRVKSQYELIESYINSFNDNIINNLIERCKNNEIDYEYYNNLLKISTERELNFNS